MKSLSQLETYGRSAHSQSLDQLFMSHTTSVIILSWILLRARHPRKFFLVLELEDDTILNNACLNNPRN